MSVGAPMLKYTGGAPKMGALAPASQKKCPMGAPVKSKKDYLMCCKIYLFHE